MEDRDVADSLLVTEVFTPSGNWSSYPPHRHDEDNYPEMTYLEETYYHRLNPAQGFGFQRVFTEDVRWMKQWRLQRRCRAGAERPSSVRRALRI